MKTKLTIAKIETAKVPSGQTETKLWDSLVNGLYLAHSASGGRRWYFRYRNDHGKVRPLKVGDYPALSIDAARDAAKVHAAAVAKGRDPAQARQEKRRSEKATLGSLLAVEGPPAQSQRSRHRQPKRGTVLPAARAFALHEARHRQALAPRLHRRLQQVKSCPAHARSSARTPARFSIGRPIRPSRPPTCWPDTVSRRSPRAQRARGGGEAPRTRRPGHRQGLARRRRFRTIRRADAARPARRHAARRACRPALERRSSDRIVLGAGQTETGAIHEIPLTPLMREVLASTVRTTSPLVFQQCHRPGNGSGWVKLQAKLVREANIGPWTIHDTRRTCRTLMSRCGVPEPAAELAIGHVRATLVALYNLDQRWAARVDAFTRVSDHVGALTRFGMNSNARPCREDQRKQNN